MTDPSTHPWMIDLLGDPEVAQICAADAELKRFLKIEAAWTRALGQVTVAPEAEGVAQAIETANISPVDLKGGFASDGVPIPALVKRLKAQIAPESVQLVHQGLTSQDVMDTSLMLALIEVLAIISRRLATLDDQLTGLQSTFSDAKLLAYTRMQPALETNVSVVIGQWCRPVRTLSADIASVMQDCGYIQWGGPIGTRDHPAADHLGLAFASNLGLNDPGEAWHTDRTVIAKVAHILSRIATATGKIGADIALMAALGSEQIVLTGGGSSAMAHKNNPVKAEVLVSLSNHAASLQTSLTNAACHEGFRSGQAWTLEWLALPQLCTTTGAGLLQTSALLKSVKTMGKV